MLILTILTVKEIIYSMTQIKNEKKKKKAHGENLAQVPAQALLHVLTRALSSNMHLHTGRIGVPGPAT
jgi:hypothetical protein